MRLLIFIVVLLLVQLPAEGQKLAGRFVQDQEFIQFNGDSISFEILSDGGLVWTLRGKGTYRIVEDYLVINTTTYTGAKSTAEATPAADPTISVRDQQGKPLKFPSIRLLDAKGHLIEQAETDENGVWPITMHNAATTAIVNLLGYESIEFTVEDDKSYRVTLVSGEAIENQVMVFQIMKLQEDEINIILLTTDFEKETTVRNLNRLERKSRKYQIRDKVYKK